MIKPAFFALSIALVGLPCTAAAQQITEPAHKPTAEIDNKRPLIPKKEKAPTTRTVSGKVVDEISGTPLKGAIVTLINLSTQEKRESITKEDGRYNFEDLSFSIDYELRARYKNVSTDPRKLSQYDHTVKSVRILTIPEVTAAANAPGEEKKSASSDIKK